MATIMRVQFNMRIDTEVNMSTSFEHLIDTEADAEAYGNEDRELLNAYMRGYGEKGS